MPIFKGFWATGNFQNSVTVMFGAMDEVMVRVSMLGKIKVRVTVMFGARDEVMVRAIKLKYHVTSVV